MVFLVVEPHAAAEALAAAKKLGCAIWLGSDALTEEEFDRWGAEGVDITRFVYPLGGAEHSVLENAVFRVAQHHPSDVIWVQRASTAA